MGHVCNLQGWDGGADAKDNAPAKAQFADNNGVPAPVLPVRLNYRPE
jgi:hypothetical protein